MTSVDASLPALAVGTFSRTGTSARWVGLQCGGRVLALDQWHQVEALRAVPQVDSVLALMSDWACVETALRALLELGDPQDVLAAVLAHSGLPLEALTVHAPIAPRQVFMSGANYFKHVVDLIVDQGAGANPDTEGMDAVQLRRHAEDLMHRRQRESYPYFFSKPVSCITGPTDPIILPPWAKQPDWELELAVVIGRAARHVRRDEALSYVAGYTIANDISNRDHIYERKDMKALGTNWITGKSCPTYLPLGPVIVPALRVPDPQQLQLVLKLNGQTMQDESTADMIFDVARQIEYLSGIVQLLPGDVICTGSPAGNGTHYRRFLQHGDALECSITGMGTMRNPVRAEVI